MVKNLPAKQEAWVQSLSLEDPLEKEMATHSCILALFTLDPDALPLKRPKMGSLKDIS